MQCNNASNKLKFVSKIFVGANRNEYFFESKLVN